MNVDMDALDQAIFALPLEEPPPGLRSAILLATAYHPVPAFSFVELATLGALCAVALWFAALLVLGGGSLFVQTLATIGSLTALAISSPTTLAWLGAGVATALWLSLFTGSQPIALLPYRYGRRTGR